jgi:dipeptidyl aminopeptidase/acylaminoacyl peptidase
MAYSRSHLTRCLLLALVALASAALLVAPARGAWPGREGPVVYAGVFPGTTLKPSLTKPAGLRRFTPGAAGSRVQFTTDTTDRDPQVSPDGRSVVFARAIELTEDSERSAIFIAAIDGSGVRQLTDGGSPEGSDTQPTFTASGQRIVFVRGGAGPYASGDLYSIGLDGSGLTPLTSGPAADRMPAASPTGRQIAFVRSFQRPDGIEAGPHIYSMRPDGSQLRNLTPRLGDAPWDPDFSPSGKVIAFATEGNQLRGDIFTMRANGGPIRRLTNRVTHDRRHDNPHFPRPFGYTNPAFSPAGDSILAVARSGTSPRLARIRLADPDHPHVFGTSLLGSAPAWAPAAPGR